MNAVFLNRYDAGRKLAKKLSSYHNHSQTIILGLPRGGVPVAYEIAKNLNLPWDVCLVRKLGLPGFPETAMGAIAENASIHEPTNETTIIDRQRVKVKGVSQEQINAIAAREKAELKWRANNYQRYRPMLTIAQRTIILVDDGIATGLTMHAAIELLRQHQPKQIIVATPVIASQAIERLKTQIDKLIYSIAPTSLGAVGFWYEDFSQVTDREVCDLLSLGSYSRD